MNLTNGYGIASSYGNYGAEKTSSTSKKAFTIPALELADEKSTQKNKNGAISTVVSSTVSGTVSLYKKCDYNPFKDMAKTGSVNLPEYMQTKTTPTRSDEEILKDIEELAKEHARIGKSNNSDEKFLELMDEYISSVSPDRASILKNAVTEINERLNEFSGMANSQDYSMSAAFQQVDSQRKHKEDEEDKKEPIDYFLEALKNKEKGKGSGGTTSGITKNGDYYTVNIDYGGGKTTTLNYDSNGKFVSMQMQGKNYHVGNIDILSGAVVNAEILDDNGDRTLVFDGNDLSQVYTKEEDERRLEMLAVYNASFDAAYGRHLGAEYHHSKAYKEAYNSTYERLTNGSVA